MEHLIHNDRKNAINVIYDIVFDLFLQDLNAVCELPIVVRELGKYLGFDIILTKMDDIIFKILSVLLAKGMNIF